jgi:hypothetical protein
MRKTVRLERRKARLLISSQRVTVIKLDTGSSV